MYIIHVANKEEYEKEIRTGFYGRRSVERCGFIHCSDLDTYYLVAPNFRNDTDEKVILVIDTDKTEPEIRWEDGSVHPSSVNYVHQKDAHFHAAAERALDSAPGREEA